MEGLTAGFGMGPGVPPPLWLPENSMGAVARADTICMPTHPVHPKFSIWIHLASDCAGNISVLIVYLFVHFLEQKLISALSDIQIFSKLELGYQF